MEFRLAYLFALICVFNSLLHAEQEPLTIMSLPAHMERGTGELTFDGSGIALKG